MSTMLTGAGRSDVDVRVRMFEQIMSSSTKHVLKRSGVARGSCVADLGCGRGDVSFILSSMVGQHGVVYAIDLNEDRLVALRREAEERGVRNIVALHGHVEDVLSGLAPMNAIYSRFLLMHSKDPALIITKCYDGLVGGGSLVMEEPMVGMGQAANPNSTWNRAISCYERLCVHEGIDPDYGYKLCRDVTKSGFLIKSACSVQEHIPSELSDEYVIAAMRAHRERYITAGIMTEDEYCSIIDEAAHTSREAKELMPFHGVMQVVAAKESTYE